MHPQPKRDDRIAPFLAARKSWRSATRLIFAFRGFGSYFLTIAGLLSARVACIPGPAMLRLISPPGRCRGRRPFAGLDVPTIQGEPTRDSPATQLGGLCCSCRANSESRFPRMDLFVPPRRQRRRVELADARCLACWSEMLADTERAGRT